MDLVKNKQIYFILILKLDRKTFYFEIDCFFECKKKVDLIQHVLWG